MYDLEKLLDSGSLSGLPGVDNYINEYNDYNSSISVSSPNPDIDYYNSSTQYNSEIRQILDQIYNNEIKEGEDFELTESLSQPSYYQILTKTYPGGFHNFLFRDIDMGPRLGLEQGILENGGYPLLSENVSEATLETPGVGEGGSVDGLTFQNHWENIKNPYHGEVNFIRGIRKLLKLRKILEESKGLIEAGYSSNLNEHLEKIITPVRYRYESIKNNNNKRETLYGDFILNTCPNVQTADICDIPGNPTKCLNRKLPYEINTPERGLYPQFDYEEIMAK